MERQGLDVWTQKDIERCADAWNCEAFPANPRPFANAINDGCRLNGSSWIGSDEAKRILWVLMAMCFGQLATVDLSKLWDTFAEKDLRAREKRNNGR